MSFQGSAAGVDYTSSGDWGLSIDAGAALAEVAERSVRATGKVRSITAPHQTGEQRAAGAQRLPAPVYRADACLPRACLMNEEEGAAPRLFAPVCRALHRLPPAPSSYFSL